MDAIGLYFHEYSSLNFENIDLIVSPYLVDRDFLDV